jgi:hypothetical protein
VRALGVGRVRLQAGLSPGSARLGKGRNLVKRVGRICLDSCGSLCSVLLDCSVHLDSCSYNSLPLVSPMLIYPAFLRSMDYLYCARK